MRKDEHMTDTTKSKAATPKKSSTELIYGTKVMVHGYTAVPNILVRAQARLGISTTQFNIIVQLLSYWMHPEKPPFPSKKDLAKRMGITPATVRINIKALEDAGYIEREQQITAHGDYGSNIYHLRGLVAKLKTLVPDFDEEREERRKARTKTETPNARSKLPRKGPAKT
jgi:DNA-binding transcriptional ArsR family regulator